VTSKYGYKPSRKFYKLLDYHLAKMRRVDPLLNAKFVDPTRHFLKTPFAYPEIELWVEKEDIRYFLGNLAARYRLSIQVLKGFASLSMYRRALIRAAKRGVRKILYIGDHDPSGLLIEEVAEKEMGINIERVAVTLEQAKRLRLPSIPVNEKDSRAKDYIAKYGNRCWEVEAIRPRTFHKIVEEKLRENVPQEYLAKAEAWDRATRIAMPVAERLKTTIVSEVSQLLEKGMPEEEILAQLASKYGLRLRKSRTKRSNTDRAS